MDTISTNCFSSDKTDSSAIPVVDDDDELLRYGVVRIPLPESLLERRVDWAKELSQITPMIMAGEGDGDFAFYRNIMDEPEFPFDMILAELGPTFERFFGVDCTNKRIEDEIRLDDAFCIHYNMTHQDTTGAKHMDPSDITVNMCLFASSDMQGSFVRFYGHECLESRTEEPSTLLKASRKGAISTPSFATRQIPGFASIHWGHHPHETTRLEMGERTNVILTYCFKDSNRSTVANRSCYFP